MQSTVMMGFPNMLYPRVRVLPQLIKIIVNLNFSLLIFGLLFEIAIQILLIVDHMLHHWPHNWLLNDRLIDRLDGGLVNWLINGTDLDSFAGSSMRTAFTFLSRHGRESAG